MPLIPKQKKQDASPDWLSIKLDSAKDAELLRQVKQSQNFIDQIEKIAEGSYSPEQLAALQASRNNVLLAQAQLLERQKIRVLQDAQKKEQVAGVFKSPRL